MTIKHDETGYMRRDILTTSTMCSRSRRPTHIAGHRGGGGGGGGGGAGVDQMSRHVSTCIVRPAVLPGTTVGPVTKLYKRQKVDSVALDTTEPSFGHVA